MQWEKTKRKLATLVCIIHNLSIGCVTCPDLILYNDMHYQSYLKDLIQRTYFLVVLYIHVYIYAIGFLIFKVLVYIVLYSSMFKTITASFKTKDTLREEDVALTQQIQAMEHRYKELYVPVQRMDTAYSQCKENFALTR